MNELETLEIFFKEHKEHSGSTFETQSAEICTIEQIGEKFLTGNGHAEDIIREALGNQNLLVRACAMHVLMKARILGKRLQEITLQKMEKLEKTGDQCIFLARKGF